MAYYRQPKFYRSFQCMGGKCPTNCCFAWRIDWTKEEVDKLKSANCSPELREIIQKSFKPMKNNDDIMVVNINSDKPLYCPLLTDDMMCRIQREIGESYLSYTCREYPRTMFICQDIATRTCSASCYYVAKIMYTNENAMDLVSAPLEAKEVKVRFLPDSALALKHHPELKYRNDLFMFFYDIISNKKRTLETSLVLGGLAAQKLTEFIARGEHDRIPEIIKSLHSQLNVQSIDSLENINPNYGLSLGFAGTLVDWFATSDIFNVLKENGKLSVSKYEQGRSIFNTHTKDKPHFLRNVALNFLIEGEIPFFHTEKSLFENYCYYVATISAVKLICATISYRDQAVNDNLFASLSFFIRGMYHSKDSISPFVYDLLKEKNVCSPAKIALLLK